jgi:predicted RND superfamily exporter protein
MYWLGWELGAVEAISLSILVGSSVDYCLHLVEGYLLAGETIPATSGHTMVHPTHNLIIIYNWHRGIEFTPLYILL